MVNFIKAVSDVLEEQGKTTKDLFDAGIISQNTFYKYNQRNPSLKTLTKIVNFLQVSIDYLFQISNVNEFHPYSFSQQDFYENLMSLIKSANISCRKFSKDLHYSRDNILRWKNGTEPSLACLFEIADYFHCSVDELLN